MQITPILLTIIITLSWNANKPPCQYLKPCVNQSNISDLNTQETNKKLFKLEDYSNNWGTDWTIKQVPCIHCNQDCWLILKSAIHLTNRNIIIVMYYHVFYQVLFYLLKLQIGCIIYTCLWLALINKVIHCKGKQSTIIHIIRY